MPSGGAEPPLEETEVYDGPGHWNCPDPDCDTRVEGANPAEVIEKSDGHLQSAHGMTLEEYKNGGVRDIQEGSDDAE